MWLTERVGGLLALELLTAVVLLGIAVSAQWRSARFTEAKVSGLHRWFSLGMLVFLAIHIITALTDSYVSIAWVSVFVPLTSAYKTGWVALGTLAFDVLLALMISSYLRTRIPRKAWTVIHRLAYLCWGLATIHALGAASDSTLTYVLAISGVVLVGAAALVRFLRPPSVTVNAHPQGLPGITEKADK